MDKVQQDIETQLAFIVKSRLNTLTLALKNDKLSDRSQNPFLSGFSQNVTRVMGLERSLLSKLGFTCEDIICDTIKLLHPSRKFINRVYDQSLGKNGKTLKEKKDNDCCYMCEDGNVSKIYIFEIKTGGKLDKNKAKKDIEALKEKSVELKRKYPSCEIFPVATVLFPDKKHTGLSNIKANCKAYNIPCYFGDDAFAQFGIPENYKKIIFDNIQLWSIEYNKVLTA